MALKRDVAKTWKSIEYEAARREMCLEEEAAKKAAERSQPRSKRVHVPKPWESQGSEVCVCDYLCVLFCACLCHMFMCYGRIALHACVCSAVSSFDSNLTLTL